MVRSLALAVALALGTVSIPAHALGLGDIKSRSALNQQFDADIDLLSVASGELESVRVRLADQNAFDRAGVERPFFLTLLKFSPQVMDNGKTVIRVSSDFPIREPFLNFLVEVNWPRGKLLREYTVLLDPPTTTKRRAPKVAPAPARVEVSKPRPLPKPAPAPVLQQTGEREYGPVKASETLWSIASSLRPSGVSMAQMMIALQRANPQAFIDGNINQLRKGQILRVPDTDEILRISRQEAQSAYREQQDQWVEKRTDKLTEAAEQAKASAPAPEAPSAPVPAEEAAELRIATARPEGEAEAGAGEDRGDEAIDDIKRELLVARENAETSRLETDALRGEIDDLEKRLQDMRRLLTLKDEQLARLQDGVANAEEQPLGAEELDPLEQALRDAEQAAAEPSDAETATEEAPSGVEEAVAKGLDPELAAKYPIMAAAIVGSAAVPEAAEPDVEAAGEPEKPPAETIQPVAEAELLAKAEAQEAAPQQPAAEESEPAQEIAEAVGEPAVEPGGEPVQDEPGVAEEPADAKEKAVNFITDYMPWLAGGAGLLVILLLLLLARRDSKKTDQQGTSDTSGDESILLSDDDGDLDLDGAEDAAAVESDTSFLSEFSPSDMNALRDDTGEVDAVSEADVYIAYGRYQQAEDLLRQAMEKDPERLALKHKLLEVFYATQNKDDFVALAQDLQTAGQDIADAEAWTRAKDMGRELDPENALFEQAEHDLRTVNVAPVQEPTPESPSSLDDDFSLDDLDLDSLASELTAPDAADEVSELNLDEIDHDLDSVLGPDSPITEDLETLDLDLPKIDSEVLDAALDASSTESAVVEDDAPESVLDEETEIDVDDLQAQLDELSDLSILDADLSQMSVDLDKHETPDESLISGIEDDLDETGLDQPISLDDVFDSEELDDAQDITELPDDRVDVDEDAVETKLDLARAYLEMGDSEGARSILDEVQNEGTQSQKDEAASMLSGLT